MKKTANVVVLTLLNYYKYIYNNCQAFSWYVLSHYSVWASYIYSLNRSVAVERYIFVGSK